MKFATMYDGSPDGQLHVVSRDLTRIEPANGVATLQSLLENWTGLAPALEAQYAALNKVKGMPFDQGAALAPLPRAWQWLDGSAFESHGDLMQKVFRMDPSPKGRPLMYQGMSDHFLPATADVPLPSEEDGIDFEGEFGVICDAVPMGTGARSAGNHIRLVVQINDWSLRTLAPIEMKKFGAAEGYPMSYGFDELVAHAARTRHLVAGTVIGSGTVSNDNYREIGSSCIAERRGIEILDQGAPQTSYMSFGDHVRMECLTRDGDPVFGAIDQRVIVSQKP